MSIERHPAFELFGDLPYYYHHSPDNVELEAVLTRGINCLMLVQMYWEEICGWYVLPKETDYTGQAFYLNTERFKAIDLTQDTLIEGDVFLFGPIDLIDWHKLHLAIFSGEYTQSGEPLLFHTTNRQLAAKRVGGGLVAQTLQQIISCTAYQHLFGIRRLR